MPAGKLEHVGLQGEERDAIDGHRRGRLNPPPRAQTPREFIRRTFAELKFRLRRDLGDGLSFHIRLCMSSRGISR